MVVNMEKINRMREKYYSMVFILDSLLEKIGEVPHIISEGGKSSEYILNWIKEFKAEIDRFNDVINREIEMEETVPYVYSKKENSVENPKKGMRVSWKFGSGRATGVIQSVHEKKVSMILEGMEVTKNGTKDNPALVIKSENGKIVLKLSSEVVMSKDEAEKKEKNS